MAIGIFDLLTLLGAVVVILGGLWGLMLSQRRHIDEKFAALGEQLTEINQRLVAVEITQAALGERLTAQGERLAKVEKITTEALAATNRIDNRLSRVKGYLRGRSGQPLDTELTSTSP